MTILVLALEGLKKHRLILTQVGLVLLFFPTWKDAHTKEKINSHYYFVQDQLCLSEIAVILYGKSKKWKEIASWNHLKKQNHVQIGQKLFLQEAPLLAKVQGEKLLLSMWRKRLQMEKETPEKIQKKFSKFRMKKKKMKNELMIKLWLFSH